MKATGWEYAVIGLMVVIFGTAAAVREPSVRAAWSGAFLGFIVGALFSTLVRLVTMPLQREVEALQGRVADLERRAGGSGPAGPP